MGHKHEESKSVKNGFATSYAPRAHEDLFAMVNTCIPARIR